MVFSYFLREKRKLLGSGFGGCTAKNSLLSNIMHPYVLRGLMAKACKKLKYNGNFFVGGGKNHIQIVLLCDSGVQKASILCNFRVEKLFHLARCGCSSSQHHSRRLAGGCL